MIKTILFRAAAMAALLAGLPAQPVAAAAPCPNSGLARRTVTFLTARGSFSYQVEIARTPEQQACGMMFRDAMAPRTGMSFPMTPPRATGFWMENTILPLDIIFVSPARRVLNVQRGQPYSRDVLPSAGITADVIELSAGEAERIGLKPGDRVK